MGKEVVLVVAALTGVFFCAWLVFFFFFLRLWIQALLTNTPVRLLDIVRMRLSGCPPELLVRAMIALRQRGVKVTALEAEQYYLATFVRGERIATAGELADLLEAAKRDAPGALPH
jgi:uncharacterized protein YqfA (UPF0365 family)